VETIGLGLHFEDLGAGRRFKTIGRTVTESDVVSYVNCLGLVEVLFTDAEFRAKHSDIKGRVVPGMLVHGFAEGLLIQAMMQHTALALLEMNLKIHQPVFVGDTIHVEVEVVEARLSKSRPGRGIVRSINRIVNQHGAMVISYQPVRMVKCREAAAA
jgi:acyl dehydratase